MHHLINIMQQKITSIKKILSDQKLFLMSILAFVAAFYIGNALAVDPSTDILQGAKADVTTNFGPGSTFMYVVLAVEIVSGIIAFNKTKNLVVLSGFAIVIIFVNIAFGII